MNQFKGTKRQVTISDSTGQINAIWFDRPYAKKLGFNDALMMYKDLKFECLVLNYFLDSEKGYIKQVFKKFNNNSNNNKNIEYLLDENTLVTN